MFGDNPMRKKEESDGHLLHVQSVFSTIQGEGPLAGHASTFIRLWGCHLACTFCDTDFESVKDERRVDQLLHLCALPANLVVLTGGEPMRQNIVPLIAQLLDMNKKVQIETAGTFWWPALQPLLDTYPDALTIVVSPKTPQVHPSIKQNAHAWKYLISVHSMSFDPATGLPSASTQIKSGGGPRHPLALPPDWVMRGARDRIYLQPMDEGRAELTQDNVRKCIELCLVHGYSLSLQQHKIIGVP